MSRPAPPTADPNAAPCGAAPLSDALARLPPYPFAAMRALFEGLRPAPGLPLLDMALGDPLHPPPPLLTEVLARHAPLWVKYPPMPGIPALREAIAAWLTRRYALPAGRADPETTILPLAGTKEGLFLVAQAVIPDRRAGQVPAVLVPDPAYPVYEGAAVFARAETVYLPTGPETGHLPRLEAIEAALLARTAMVYLCSPSNPEGAIADLDYLKQALALARRHGFVLAVDECYAEIWFDRPPPGGLEAAEALGPGPAGHPFDNLLVFHSLSKRSSAAGLRSGFVAGDPRLIQAFKAVRNVGGAQVPIPVQEAAAALWSDEAHVEANRARYRAKIDQAGRVLGNRFGWRRPAGGFFLWLEVGDSIAAATRLYTEAALRTLPGAYLGRLTDAAGRPATAGRLRVAIVHPEAEFAAGLDRLAATL